MSTGVPPLDDLLRLMAQYAQVDLGVSVESEKGTLDNEVARDVGSAFGRAVRQVLEESDPVIGPGSFLMPCGDALVACALDVRGPTHASFDVVFTRDTIGALATENIKVFFESVAHCGQLSLHILQMGGANTVHLAEAVFKGFGKCLFEGTHRVDR